MSGATTGCPGCERALARVADLEARLRLRPAGVVSAAGVPVLTAREQARGVVAAALAWELSDREASRRSGLSEEEVAEVHAALREALAARTAETREAAGLGRKHAPRLEADRTVPPG